MLTRGLTWAGLALFVYFLLTRLRTLTVLASTWLGLREAAAVRIRRSRMTVEMLVTGGVLGLWVASALERGHLDWEVGGAGSPVKLELSGAWFVVGVVAITAAATALLAITAMLAFARAEYLRELFPRSAAASPLVLRVALLNPGAVFFVPRRSPVVWAWTEGRAAAFGFATTLAMAAVDEDLPGATLMASEAVEDANEMFELDERLATGGRALRWNELAPIMSVLSGAPPTEPDPLLLPPAASPVSAQAAGYVLGIVARMRRGTRRAHQAALLRGFSERATLEAVLADAPGDTSEAHLANGLDGLLGEVRGMVFDAMKRELPPRSSRQLTRAYRRDAMAGAAAWMIENIPGYPDLFEGAARAELARQENLIDQILTNIDQKPRQA